MKKALILTYNRFPNGDAGSVRQEVFGKLLETIGYSVMVIGMGSYTGTKLEKHQGLSYLSFRNKRNDFFSRVNNIFGYKSKLKRYLKTSGPIDLIIVVQLPLPAINYIKNYAIKNRITLLHDSVEWYSPDQFTLKKLSPSYILKDLYNKKIINKDFKVVAISSFLNRHFEYRGIESTIIPVIMDANKIDYSKTIKQDTICFLYAGSPGKKDYLNEIIQAFCLLPENVIRKISLSILGVTKSQLINIGVSEESISCLGSSIKIMGRVSRDEVLQSLKTTDFTLLLRPSHLRYANAGFPTKVVESLMTGTPVICNITSDLGKYIVDMENGIVVNECSANSLSHSILKAVNLTLEERIQMQQNARKSAEDNFDYKKYLSKLDSLISRGGAK